MAVESFTTILPNRHSIPSLSNPNFFDNACSTIFFIKFDAGSLNRSCKLCFLILIPSLCNSLHKSSKLIVPSFLAIKTHKKKKLHLEVYFFVEQILLIWIFLLYILGQKILVFVLLFYLCLIFYLRVSLYAVLVNCYSIETLIYFTNVKLFFIYNQLFISLT